jgi:hypothetical protein
VEIVDDGAAAAPTRPRKRTGRAVVPTIIGMLIIGTMTAGGIWVANNPQPIIDQVTVWQFEPDAVIEGHVERLQLTDHGRFLYYASRPAVSSGDRFASDCPIDHNEQEFGVLGCYVHADKSIFVFDVTDPRLDGAEEVVAAHEMLHAAWDRMGAGERDRLTELLEAEFAKLVDDPEFEERMAFYARNEPGQRANELHSIIGTEVASISEELEEYYAQYFEDRAVVTGLHASSYAVFVDLQAQADAHRRSNGDHPSFRRGRLRHVFERLRPSSTRDIEAFNSIEHGADSSRRHGSRRDGARDRLVERGAELDALYASITARQAEYEALTTELETVNETSVELQRGLNIGGEVESGL